MGCSGCSTKTCGSSLPRGCKNNGNCGSGGCNQLSVFNWLSDIQTSSEKEQFKAVEVRFKGMGWYGLMGRHHRHHHRRHHRHHHRFQRKYRFQPLL